LITFHAACQGGGTTCTSKVLEGIHNTCSEALVSMMSGMRNIWETHAGNDTMPGDNDFNIFQEGI
jgi:hypothetical protein